MRVIAGRYRGRPLRAPKGQGTRPTSDRVREALFQILGDLTGFVVLDVYAGTGALGIEAMSRGAERALFVESGRAALSCLRSNLESLDLATTCDVLPLKLARGRRVILAKGPFDLVLCDPPWAEVSAALAALTDLLRGGLLRGGGRLVLEHRAADELRLPPGFPLPRTAERRWGDTGVSLFSAEE